MYLKGIVNLLDSYRYSRFQIFELFACLYNEVSVNSHRLYNLMKLLQIKEELL
jgi:hypothetical protein